MSSPENSRTLSKLETVAFSGPDGTGKTSCANIIAKIFSKRGFNIKRAWIKNVHTVAIVAMMLMEKLSYRHVVRSTSGTYVTSSLSRYKSAWLWLSFIGVVIKFLPMRISTILLGKLARRPILVIADRYILDSMVHILISEIFLNMRNNIVDLKEAILSYVNSIPLKIMRSLLIKSSMTVVLNGDVAELIERNKKAGKPDPYWYMTLQKYLYRVFIKILGIPYVYIDTSKKPLNKVCTEVLAGLMEKVAK